MSVLSTYFDHSVDQSSPVHEDLNRVVRYDEDGTPLVTFVPVDYPSIQAGYGVIADWSLDALLKAGINPNFPIHTGNPTRIEGIDVISQAEAVADSILAEPVDESSKN